MEGQGHIFTIELILSGSTCHAREGGRGCVLHSMNGICSNGVIKCEVIKKWVFMVIKMLIYILGNTWSDC